MEFMTESIVKGEGGQVKYRVDIDIRHVFLYFTVVIPNFLHVSLVYFCQVDGGGGGVSVTDSNTIFIIAATWFQDTSSTTAFFHLLIQ